MTRFIAEESKKQANIESITRKAIPQVKESAKPENISDDWLFSFLDKCKIISDKQLQILWSRILSGEANRPGSFSKRTINLLESFDQKDATLFVDFCAFCLYSGKATPLIYDPNHIIYNQKNIDFLKLQHLDAIGLIRFDNIAGFEHTGMEGKKLLWSYYDGRRFGTTFNKDGKKSLRLGKVILSEAGEQLASICNPKPIDGFVEYILDNWKKQGAIIELKP